jgi:hypothetical protein
MNVAVVLAAILVQTNLLVWIEARDCVTFRPIEAGLRHIEAMLTAIGARFERSHPQRNGADHVAVDYPRLTEMRE